MLIRKGRRCIITHKLPTSVKLFSTDMIFIMNYVAEYMNKGFGIVFDSVFAWVYYDALIV